MVSDETIQRINELARKAKVEELNEEEKVEQQALRRAYIDAVKASVIDQVENIRYVEDDSKPERNKILH